MDSPIWVSSNSSQEKIFASHRLRNWETSILQTVQFARRPQEGEGAKCDTPCCWYWKSADRGYTEIADFLYGRPLIQNFYLFISDINTELIDRGTTNRLYFYNRIVVRCLSENYFLNYLLQERRPELFITLRTLSHKQKKDWFDEQMRKDKKNS